MLKKISFIFLVFMMTSAFCVIVVYGAENLATNTSGKAYHNQKGLDHFKKGFYDLTPKKQKEEAKPPSTLVSFDEGNEKITTEEAVDAVTPEKRRRRWRRGRRRKRKNQNDESKPSGDDSKPGPESGHGG